MKHYFYLIATDQINGPIHSVVKFILLLVSYVYSALLTIRNFAYKIRIIKSFKFSLPVISVGNLSVGGTGKTPFVHYLANILKDKGLQTVILTRGYMAKKTCKLPPISDEVMMLKNELVDIPVLVGANRIQNAQNYLKGNNTDIFLLDDGFQHIKLSRDLDIVLIDSTNPWGNGHLVPKGILREFRCALKRADVLVITKVDLGQDRIANIGKELTDINPEALMVKAIHEPISLEDMRTGELSNLNSVKNERIVSVCSIGSPNSFKKTLVGIGSVIEKQFIFMDHHCYSGEDIKKIDQYCNKTTNRMIITTEKDAVKLKNHINLFSSAITILVLKIKIKIVDGEGKIIERINHLL